MQVALPLPITTTTVFEYSNAPASAEPAWAAGTAYTTGQRVQVAGKDIYEALVGNTGFAPASNPGKWLLIGATNPWRPFDGVLSSVAVGNGSYHAGTFNAEDEPAFSNGLAYRLAPGIEWDTVVALGLKGMALDIWVRTASGTTTLLRRRNWLLGNYTGGNWWLYSSTPPLGLNRVAISLATPIPATAKVYVSVISPAGGSAEMGTLAFGMGVYIGDVMYPAEVGVVDYSLVQEDDLGGVELIPRAAVNRAEYNLSLPESLAPDVYRRLIGLRATPAMWVPSTEAQHSAGIIYGYAKRYSVTYQQPGLAVVSLSLRGLA